jgi:hypothetical protein
MLSRPQQLCVVTVAYLFGANNVAITTVSVLRHFMEEAEH